MHRVAFNFQGNAVLGVLAFLGTGFLLLLLAIALVYLIATRRWRPARGVALLAGIVVGLYAVVLAGFSLASHEDVLGPGDDKYFCEIDCHLAYSVVGVRKTRVLGEPSKPLRAVGDFYVVKLNVKFDERTISSRRPRNAPLRPNPRLVALVDETGRHIFPSVAGLAALEAAEGKQVPLTEPLRPGESYTTRLVFDPPSDVRNPRLLITESDLVTHLLIGHENSFFHKKTLFRLEPSGSPSGVRSNKDVPDA